MCPAYGDAKHGPNPRRSWLAGRLELVAPRLGDLTGPQRAVLQLLTLCEPLGQEELAALAARVAVLGDRGAEHGVVTRGVLIDLASDGPLPDGHGGDRRGTRGGLRAGWG